MAEATHSASNFSFDPPVKTSPQWLARISPRHLWMIFGIWILVRLIFAAILPLVPDEAFYWDLSRHLAPGYLDHPPLLAVFIWFSTLIFGINEFGVRFFAVILMGATFVILLTLGHSLWKGDPRKLAVLALFWFCSPLFHILGMIFTPDTPSIFFSTLSLGCFVYAARLEKKVILPWLLGGLFCGVALTAKYTSVLLPGAIFWAIILSPQGRAELRRPWIYLGALLGLVAFSPVIYWNATHDWASFQFQINHGLNASTSAAAVRHTPAFWEGGPLFLLMQSAVATPILFGLGIMTLFSGWRSYRSFDLGKQMLLWAATLPLVFFGYASTRSHGEANWPDFAYFPLSLLIVEWASQKDWTTRRWLFLRAGLVLALFLTLLVHLVPVLLRLPVKLPGKVMQLSGIPTLAAATERARDSFAKLPPFLPKEKTPMVTSRHQDAAMLGFYLPDHPDVWAVSDPGKRSVAFEYFEPQPDFENSPATLYIGSKPRPFAERFQLQFEKVPSPYAIRWMQKTSGDRGERAWIFSLLRPKSGAEMGDSDPGKVVQPENPSLP